MSSLSGSLCILGSDLMPLPYKPQFTCPSICRTASSCELGRKDYFPAPQLETWCGAVNPSVSFPYDVQNAAADPICTYLVRGKKDRYAPDPKASVKKICPFNLSLNSPLQSKTDLSLILSSPVLLLSPYIK